MKAAEKATAIIQAKAAAKAVREAKVATKRDEINHTRLSLGSEVAKIDCTFGMLMGVVIVPEHELDRFFRPLRESVEKGVNCCSSLGGWKAHVGIEEAVGPKKYVFDRAEEFSSFAHPVLGVGMVLSKLVTAHSVNGNGRWKLLIGVEDHPTGIVLRNGVVGPGKGVLGTLARIIVDQELNHLKLTQTARPHSAFRRHWHCWPGDKNGLADIDSPIIFCPFPLYCC
eukprot:scaffold1949_cov176-Ochromonas_danica.AAC.2